jgi:hypothetical protein
MVEKKKQKNQESNMKIEKKFSSQGKFKSRRSKDPLAALEKKYTLKTRTDEIDYDYLNKLNEKEKLWLAKFTSEEIHASVNKDGKKNKFNKSRKSIKKIYNRNNSRNRCILTREKAKGMEQYLEDHKETLMGNNPESFLIAKMDLERDGWVDNDGTIIHTEKELFKKEELEAKNSIATNVSKKKSSHKVRLKKQRA